MGRVVLGIDAAWTNRSPSGVALAAQSDHAWRIISLAPSYEDFIGEPVERVDTLAERLLEKARQLTNSDVTLVAVDMPMSYVSITGRRVSDDAISKVYGARHASTHSPSEIRPGRISSDLVRGFENAGYSLKTIDREGRLLEVYPHPALIEYTAAARRLPYKYAKRRKYWPSHTPEQRLQELRKVWFGIASALDRCFTDFTQHHPFPEPGASAKIMKSFEDMLDAAICAWVGISALDNDVVGYGDSYSTIWVPRPQF